MIRRSGRSSPIRFCATPYTRIEERAIDAAPGALVQTRGHCQTHVPFFGDGDFLPGTPARQP